MYRFIHRVLLTALVFFTTNRTFARVIDFDDQPVGPLELNAYADATFTTPDPDGVLVFDSTTRGSHAINPGGFVNDLTVTFTNPVNDLQFFTFADNHADMADIDVFVDGVFAGTVDLIGRDGPSTSELQDLSAFERVTSIRIHGFRPDDGVGYDKFSFAVVPEPCSFSMIIAGFAFTGLCSHKRRSPRRKQAYR